ncbi:MAG: putative rane protein [Mycobacterium sp.]|nr:putative rane protein [Mycobacterium sp.]
MTTWGEDLGRLIPRRLLKTDQIHHPAVLQEAVKRNKSVELRIADAITTFAGSMSFVWLHAVLFAVWMVFLERSPWPTLTLVVSLEAIFLSTFVMIGQNRQAAFQQAKADHDFGAQELELKTNTELTRQIHVLTTELHKRLIGPEVAGRGSPPPT